MLRSLIFRVHMLVGFAVGLLLTSAGLTGSLLVWRHELDELLHPELLRVDAAGERRSLEEVVGAVRAAYPDQVPLRIQLPRAPHQTFEVTTAGADPLQVYVHPYQGTVLGARGTTETFANALFEWHTKLFAGETGEWIMGSAGLLLVLLVLTGLVVWWPGMRRMWDGFRVQWRANWKRVNFDLHRAVGIWSTAFLTAAAVTGSSLEFHDGFMAVINRVTASPPRPTPPPAPATGGRPASLDRLATLGARRVPGGEVTYVTLPTSPGQPVLVRTKVPAELHPNGRNFIYLHPETGKILEVEEAMRAPLGTRAYNTLYPIHIGRWGGVVSRVLYTLLGLTPAILFVSGCLMWWNRSGRRLVHGKAPRAAAARGRRPRPIAPV